MSTTTPVEHDAPRTHASPTPWARSGLLALALLVLIAGAAALGGWAWWSWWGPSDKGVIYEYDTGRYRWFPQPTDPGEAHVTRATFEFVVIGFLLALVIGIVVALVTRSRPLVGLGVAIVGAVLGAYVMWQVGVALSPPDPNEWADKAHACTDTVTQCVQHHLALPGNMAVAGWTPYLSWPIGSIFGFLCVMLATSGDRRLERPYDNESVAVPPEAVDADPDRPTAAGPPRPRIPTNVIIGCILAWAGSAVLAWLGSQMLGQQDFQAGLTVVDSSNIRAAGATFLGLAATVTVLAALAFGRLRWAAAVLRILAIVILVLGMAAWALPQLDGDPVLGLWLLGSSSLILGGRATQAWFERSS